MGEWLLVAFLALVLLAWLVAVPVLLISLWLRVNRLERDVLHLRSVRLPRPIPAAGTPPGPSAAKPTAVASIWLDEPSSKQQPAGVAVPVAEAPPGSPWPHPAPAGALSPAAPGVHNLKLPARADSEAAKSPQSSIEEVVATRWMTWVGALAVVIGVGFAFKYLVDHELLGKTGRVAIGLISGMACLAGGTYALTRQFRYLGQGLVGAAQGILYLSLFAGFRWYRLDFLPIEAAFAGMVAVTAVGLGFSTWFKAQPTAVLGLLGGLLTPVMLSRGQDERWILFSYLLVLDLGVLGIAAFRNWNLLKILAAVGTVWIWLAWFSLHYRPAILGETVVLMSMFFVLFALLGFIHQVVRRMPVAPADYVVILATPILYFGGLYGVTKPAYADWHGLMAIAMAGIYLLLAAVASVRHPTGKQMIAVLGGIAASFLTLAIPLQLTGHWIAVAWAAESVLLVELGLRFHERALRYSGFALLLVVQCILVLYAARTVADPYDFATRFTRPRPDPAVAAALPEVVTAASAAPTPHWTDVFNGRSLSFLASGLALALLAWEYHRRRDAGLPAAPATASLAAAPGSGPWPDLASEARAAATILTAAVPVVLLAMVLLETFAFGHARDWITPSFFGAFLAASALAGAGTLWLSQHKPLAALRPVALVVFGLVALLVLISLVGNLGGWRAEWQRIALDAAAARNSHWRFVLINPRGLGLLLATLAAAFSAILPRLMMARGAIPPEPAARDAGRQVSLLLGLLAYLSGLTMLTLEVYTQGVIRNWQTATSLAITLGWTLYAVGTLIAGIYYRAATVRILSLALFLLTTLKVFLYDVWHLSPEIRTFAFIALGVALLLVSFLYRRFQRRIHAWIKPAALLALALATWPGKAALAAGPASPEQAPASRHRYRWPVELSRRAAAAPEGQDLVRILIAPEVYAVSDEHLAELRLLGERGTGEFMELPYILVQPSDADRVVERLARMLNLSTRGGNTEFLLDASGAAEPVNSLLIQVDDRERNFERAVAIYGADRRDAAEWNLLTKEGYLLDVTRPGHRLTVGWVGFPESRFAYYKVFIHDGDAPALRITGARLFDRVETRPPRREHALTLVRSEDDREQKETRVLFDLGHDKLPTVSARFRARFDGNFYRTATLAVGDEPSETAIWRTVALGQLYQIDRNGVQARSDTFHYSQAAGRYLRLTIQNGDDRPLDIVAGEAFSIDRFLVTDRRLLPSNEPVALALYAGAEALGAPEYDLSRTVEPYHLADLPLVSLGPRENNPHHTGPRLPARPWTERHQGLIWIMTIAGIAVLGLATALLLRGAARDPGE